MEKGKSCWMGDWSECLLLREAFGCVCRRIPLPPAGPDALIPSREKSLQPSWGDLCTLEAIRRGCRGNVGKTQGGLPLGNPVCLWQTELFK